MIDLPRYYTDPQGRQINVTEEPSSRWPSRLHVEVVDAGEVVDHFSLNGESALAHTAQKRKWVRS